jgi:UDP-N-acetylglucosamine--N-acetylmuramyl-(pentapeptide) pyrophosphoryl-undecaprenol N-acetylglucosamine transferase
MTCAELTAIGVPAIYVPLPIGNGEQAGNSRPIVDAGGGLQVADEAVTSEWLTTTVLSLVEDEGRLRTMASAARSLGDRDAGEAMVRWIGDVVGQRRKGR